MSYYKEINNSHRTQQFYQIYFEQVTPIFNKNAPKAEDKNDPVTPQSSAQKADNAVYYSLHESKLSNLFFFKQVGLT